MTKRAWAKPEIKELIVARTEKSKNKKKKHEDNEGHGGVGFGNHHDFDEHS